MATKYYGYIYSYGDDVRADMQKQVINSSPYAPKKLTIYKDDTTRHSWFELLDTLRKGDMLIVENVAVLGNNLKELSESLRKLMTIGIQLIEGQASIPGTGKADFFNFSFERFNRDALMVIDVIDYCNAFKESATSESDAVLKYYRRLAEGKNKFPKEWDSVFKQWLEHELSTAAAISELGCSATAFKAFVMASTVKTPLGKENVLRLWPRWGAKIYEPETASWYTDWNKGLISTVEFATKLGMSTSTLYAFVTVFEAINIELVCELINNGIYRIVRVVNRPRTEKKVPELPINTSEILGSFANGVITKKEAAKMLGVSPSAVYRIAFERGISKML